MGTEQIKTDLINAINQTNNPFLLLEISKLMNIGSRREEVVNLTSEQIVELKTAILEIENGGFLTHEEAKKQTEEWLKD